MAKNAHKILGVSKNCTVEELDLAYRAKLSEVQTKNFDNPEKLVQEADNLYAAYRSAYLSIHGANEDNMLPLTIEGPDSMLSAFGIKDLADGHANIQVQMHSQAQYKDGKLIKKESNRNENFLNKDGKREIKTYENGKLVRHTIDGKDVLKK